MGYSQALVFVKRDAHQGESLQAVVGCASVATPVSTRAAASARPSGSWAASAASASSSAGAGAAKSNRGAWRVQWGRKWKQKREVCPRAPTRPPSLCACMEGLITASTALPLRAWRRGGGRGCATTALPAAWRGGGHRRRCHRRGRRKTRRASGRESLSPRRETCRAVCGQRSRCGSAKRHERHAQSHSAQPVQPTSAI